MAVRFGCIKLFACWRLGLLAGLLSLSLGWAAPARSIDSETLALLTYPLDPKFLNPNNIPNDGSIVTKNTISQSGLTIPSLWWAAEQFGGDVLINWLAFSGTDGELRRVDLLVSQENWSRLSYLDHYTFINEFGTAAKDFGYSTRVFNLRGELLGAYICRFRQAPPSEGDQQMPRECSIFLDPAGPGALSGAGTTPFGAGQSTGAGIGR